MKETILTQKEVNEAFINAKLEEDYNFLQDDLMKLSMAIIDAARSKIARQERAECVKIARSVNTLVADKIIEVRGKM